MSLKILTIENNLSIHEAQINAIGMFYLLFFLRMWILRFSLKGSYKFLRMVQLKKALIYSPQPPFP